MGEGAAHYSQEFREISHEPGQCTTCGLCDVSCPVLLSKRTDEFVGPMRLVANGMRGGALLFAAESSLELMASDTCKDCDLCELSCPEKIPIRRLAKHYLEQIEEIRSYSDKVGANP